MLYYTMPHQSHLDFDDAMWVGMGGLTCKIAPPTMPQFAFKWVDRYLDTLLY